MKHFIEKYLTLENIVAVLLWMLTFAWFLSVVLFLFFLFGCSVQTQKDIMYKDGQMVHHAEAFSGRFCWMSSGIEIYDKTPYWTIGSKIEQSQTDPNTTTAIVEGIVKGVKTL